MTKNSNSLSWSTGQWYHIAVTHDNVAKEIRFYRDGIHVGTATYADSALNVTAGNAYLGGYQGDTRFRGKIDDVKLYNYVRTQAQIAWDHNKGAPVAYYRFDESSGTDAYDDTGNNNATVTIGATGSQTTIAAAHTASATGKYGRCMSFDGTDDYADITNTFTPTDDFTLSVWVKKSTSQSSYKAVVSTEPYAGTDNFGIWSNGDVWYIQAAGASNSVYITSDAITYGSWTHLSLVYDSNSSPYVKFYINGVLADSSTDDPGTLTARQLHIGMYSGSNYFDGLIDDVRVYNYARTAAQVMQDYNAGAASRLGD